MGGIRYDALRHYDDKIFKKTTKDITAYEYFDQHDHDCEIYISRTPFGHRKLQILKYPTLEQGKFGNAIEKLGFNIKLLSLKIRTFFHLAERDRSGQKQHQLYNRRLAQLQTFLAGKERFIHIARCIVAEELETKLAKEIRKPPRHTIDNYAETLEV